MTNETAKKNFLHIDYKVSDACDNPDTMGYICVKCGKCGRLFEYGRLTKNKKGERKMKDGGSAFPIFDEVTGKIFPGMTLRDYFAGQALAGLMANFGSGPSGFTSNVAKQVYEMADAMLAEREKTNGKDNG